MALGYFYADQSPEQLEKRRQAINAMIFSDNSAPRSPAEGAVRGLSKVVGAWKKRGIDKTAEQNQASAADSWKPFDKAFSGGSSAPSSAPAAPSGGGWNPFGGSAGYGSDMQQAAQGSSAAQAIESIAPGAPAIESGPQLASLAYANQGAIRDDTINPDLQRNIQSSIYDVYGPGYSTEVYSGGQPGKGEGGARTGSIRHDHGNAADIRVRNPDGKIVTGNDLAPLGQYWQAQDYGGTGMEMRGGGVHLDNWTEDKLRPGMGMTWGYGDQGGSYTPEMQAALARGRSGEAPYFTMSRFPQQGPVPQQRDATAGMSENSGALGFFANPTGSAQGGEIETAPLAPARGSRVGGQEMASITPENLQERLGPNTPSQSPSQAFAPNPAPGTLAPPMEPAQSAQSAPVVAPQSQQQPRPEAQMVSQQIPYPSLSDQDIIAQIENPWQTPERRAIASQMWEERQRIRRQQNDPMYQLQMQTAQAQLAQLQNPQRTRVLSDQEKQQYGLPADGAFQVKPDGSISKIGGGGVTVNNNMGGGPELGKLSSDYGYVLDPETGQPVIDPQTGLPTAAPVPGSPAAQEIKQAEDAKGKKAESTARYSSIVLEDIGRVKDMLTRGRNQPVTGVLGTPMSMVPGSEASDVRGILDTVKANIGFDRLQKMREESPTGGALGQVSNLELGLLNATLGNIDANTLSKGELVKNLDRLENVYTQIIQKIAATGDGTFQLPDGTPISEWSAAQQDSGNADVDALIEKYGN